MASAEVPEAAAAASDNYVAPYVPMGTDSIDPTVRYVPSEPLASEATKEDGSRDDSGGAGRAGTESKGSEDKDLALTALGTSARLRSKALYYFIGVSVKGR